MTAVTSQKLSDCCCCCVNTIYSSKERKIIAETYANLPLLILSIFNIHIQTHTLVYKHWLSWILCREPDDSPVPLLLGWGGGCSLTQWWRFCGLFSLFFANTQKHRCTHRLLSASLKRSKGPRDGDGTGVDGRRALEGALQTDICPIDRLNLPGSVYTHPTDLQHACNMGTQSRAAELAWKAGC